MREWLPEAQEVVVVDSISSDGTLELIKAELRHPGLRFLTHPPGLYQSWNFGVQQIKAPYCYISTVGETISAEGLRHLASLMDQLRCDVAISLPRFIDEQGKPVRSHDWPIEDMLSTLRVREPIALEGAGLFWLTLAHYRNAILGSSASNLYRTACLQERPFPTGYGTAGDGGWGLENCLKIRLGLTPRVFSTFREHPKSYSKAEYAVDALSRKMLERIGRTYAEEAAGNPSFAGLARQLQVDRFLVLLEEQLQRQEELERCREQHRIWVLSPAAWRARQRRNAKALEIAQVRNAGLRLLFPDRV
jgi:hypothetical protein